MIKYISNDRVINFSLKKYDNPPWSDAHRVKYYASGREAIISLIDLLVMGDINHVALLPAYVPQGLYAPFEKRGWTIILYPIDINLDPIWSEVELLIEKYSPSIAILIHYFGKIQPIEQFVEVCHTNGVKVIEDHAHTLTNMDNFEYQGDYILYSLPKMVGVVDGAVLVVRDLSIDIGLLKYHIKKTNHVYIAKQSFLLFLNSFISKIPSAILVNIISTVFGKLLNSYKNLMSVYPNPNSISRLSTKIIERIDFDNVIKTRSRYAKIYEERLNENHFTKLLKIDNIQRATFGYPVLVGDRDGLYRYLSKKGVYGGYLTSNWNYIPKGDKSCKVFKKTEYIIDHHFIFPTALHLKEEDIEKIVDYANQWAKLR
jgi:hypothetical protein